MEFKPGELYKCPEYFLLIYPTKEKVTPASNAVAARTARRSAASRAADREADYWSKELDCQVRFSEPGEIFMVLKNCGETLQVLFGDKQGWIIYRDWLNIESCAVAAQPLEALNGV